MNQPTTSILDMRQALQSAAKRFSRFHFIAYPWSSLTQQYSRWILILVADNQITSLRREFTRPITLVKGKTSQCWQAEKANWNTGKIEKNDRKEERRKAAEMRGKHALHKEKRAIERQYKQLRQHLD